MTEWSIIGVPVDSSARSRGEQLAPAALRKAGIVRALAAKDLGDIAVKVDDVRRDERTGVIAYRQIIAANVAVRNAVRRGVEGGFRPLLLGGDCSFLPGALAGASIARGRLGLCFVDGHVDAYDGTTSPSGEAADMVFAVSIGRGPREWTDLAGSPPIIASGDAVILGHRTGPDDLDEISLLPPEVTRYSARDIMVSAPSEIGEWAAVRLGDRPAGFWLHFDTDVLDEGDMAASTYTGTGGLRWGDLEAMLAPLLVSRALVGLSIADFRPDLDRTGEYAHRIVALFDGARVLRSGETRVADEKDRP
jgi:arginase